MVLSFWQGKRKESVLIGHCRHLGVFIENGGINEWLFIFIFYITTDGVLVFLLFLFASW